MEFKVCDICLYDSNEDKLIIVAHNDWSFNRYPTSRYTPIGIVVIPSSHDVYGNGQCGIMSLKEMNCTTPDEGSTNRQAIYWGYNNSFVFMENPHLPSDNFSGVQSSTDPLSFYQPMISDEYYWPSPYLEDGSRNPAYYQTDCPPSPLNCLADFNGIGNSVAILDRVTVSNWKTNETISNSSLRGNYPSACCCWRFYTAGTKQGEWYLPASGELGYMLVRMKIINEAISNLINAYGVDAGVSVSTSRGYWSSSECSNTYVRYINTFHGRVGWENKSNNMYVRAFLRV